MIKGTWQVSFVLVCLWLLWEDIDQSQRLGGKGLLGPQLPGHSSLPREVRNSWREAEAETGVGTMRRSSAYWLAKLDFFFFYIQSRTTCQGWHRPVASYVNQSLLKKMPLEIYPQANPVEATSQLRVLLPKWLKFDSVRLIETSQHIIKVKFLLCFLFVCFFVWGCFAAMGELGVSLILGKLSTTELCLQLSSRLYLDTGSHQAT